MRKTLAAAIVAALCLVAAAALAEDEELIWDEALMAVGLEKGEALILVTVEDDSGSRMEGVMIAVYQGRRPQPFYRVSNADGQVELVVGTGFPYRLRFMSLDPDVKHHEEKFDVDESEDQRYALTMTYTPPTTKVFVLKGVHFHTGKATLKKASLPKLRPLLEYMKMKPEITIELGGHTDHVGSDEDNQKLSQARAEAVRAYLVKNGVDGKRITAVGYGESRPVASNDTAAGRQQNRRTEVTITSD